MVLGWLKRDSDPAAVEELISRRKYDRALSLLRMEFDAGRRDPRLRLQLADVMVMAGRGKEAVPILLGLADEFAREGFAAKAISVLKKVQKVEPGRSDVDGKLAALISDKHRPPVTAGVREPREASQEAQALAEGGDEIGFEQISGAFRQIPAEDSGAPAMEAATPPSDPAAEAPPPPEALGDELVSLIEDVLVKTAAPPPARRPAVRRPPVAAAASPLFDDFNEEELLAVIQGLELRQYEPGDLIVVAGEPGDSLFVLASGTAKAFVPSSEKHVLAREMEEGDFFGEISILSGSVRTATVTAKTRCELLELNRTALDEICTRQPRVLSVMKEFSDRRLASDRRVRGD
jgi:hypothetical protein